MLILAADSSCEMNEAIGLALRAQGHRCELAGVFEEALDFARAYDFDAIVLDFALAGFEGLRAIRAAGVRTPILMLGVLGVEDRVRALGLGADDLLARPFHQAELLARLQALARRSRGAAQSLIAIGDLVVDLDQKSAAIAGAAVPLTGKEWQMVEMLALRSGKCVTKEMLFAHLYAGRDEPEIKIIDVFVCKLRKKFAAASGGLDCIETIWGRGYTLREPGPRAPIVKPPGVTRAVIAEGKAHAVGLAAVASELGGDLEAPAQ